MIHLRRISKAFPDKVLFRDVNLSIHKGMRLGLIGANGTGKTTLFRMILGEETPDTGLVELRSGIQLGYLPQEITGTSQRSILHEVMAGRDDLLQIRAEMEKLLDMLKRDSNHQTSQTRLGQLQHQFEAKGGYHWEADAGKILSGLGFRTRQFQQSLETFSGGWRMRVALGRLLMQQPDVLLLDEPTNHLDLTSLEWLEKYLKVWQGILLLISHDRSFLDGTVNHILALEQRRAVMVSGNFSAYEKARAVAREQQRVAYRQQQREIEATERFIERFRYKNTKASQVQSRIKMLEKLDRIEAPPAETPEIHVRVPQPGRSPRILVRSHALAKAYGENEVFHDLDIMIERGDRIGLVGPNGAGKSTLLKLLAAVEMPTQGDLRWSDGVDRSYFAQHQLEQLDARDRVMDSLQKVVSGWTHTEIRSYLGGFHFTGEAVEKKVGVLSGGESSRLAFARMLANPSHILLLDEPTNHLDMQSRGVVERALNTFEGALVCISHDRHFLNVITNRIWELGDGSIHQFSGNYEYYEWKAGEKPGDATRAQEAPEPAHNAQDHRERRKLANRLKKIPVLMKDLENRLDEVEHELADPETNRDHTRLLAALEQKSGLEQKYLALLEEEEKLRNQL